MDKVTPQQLGQLDNILQFTTGILHMDEKDNTIVVALPEPLRQR